MQEEVKDKTVALSVRAGKMTSRVLRSVLRKLLTEMEKKRNNPKIHKGKQSVKSWHDKARAFPISRLRMAISNRLSA